MTTKQRLGRYLVLVGSIAIFTLASLAIASNSIVRGWESARLPEPDRTRLSKLLIIEPPQSATVSAEDALKALAMHYNPSAIGARVDQYLETVTMPGTLGLSAPVLHRPVWILRMSGFEQQAGGVVNQDGSIDAPHKLHFAYVFVDATSGEFILTVWQE